MVFYDIGHSGTNEQASGGKAGPNLSRILNLDSRKLAVSRSQLIRILLERELEDLPQTNEIPRKNTPSSFTRAKGYQTKFSTVFGFYNKHQLRQG